MERIAFLRFAAALGVGGYVLMARGSLRSLLPSLVVGVIGTGIYLVSLEFGLPEFASNFFGATIIYIGCAISAKLLLLLLPRLHLKLILHKRLNYLYQ